MNVLIALASKHGATGEIAARIGRRLAECGFDGEVKNLEQVSGLGGYDAFVNRKRRLPRQLAQAGTQVSRLAR